MLIKRQDLNTKISTAVKRSRIVSLLGPRQCGKTTFARAFAKNYSNSTTYYDLENTEDLALLENPQTVLYRYRPETAPEIKGEARPGRLFISCLAGRPDQGIPVRSSQDQIRRKK